MICFFFCFLLLSFVFHCSSFCKEKEYSLRGEKEKKKRMGFFLKPFGAESPKRGVGCGGAEMEEKKAGGAVYGGKRGKGV